ncbi:MAG: ABC transporter ATP-binding protein [Lachnospiraceae bacterium]
MKHIFANFKKYWYFVILILILLLGQAYCDLSLPDYTSKIIDVGIAGSGVQHAVPEYISSQGLEMVALLLDDEEREMWQDAFVYDEEMDCYRLDSTEEEAWTALDDTFKQVICIVYMVSSMDPADMQDAGLINEQLGELPAIDMDNLDFSVLEPAMLEQLRPMIAEMRSGMEEQLSSLGDSMIMSLAKEFAKSEYEACGIDLSEIQKNYLWKSGSKMLLMALGLAMISILVSFLASRVGAGVGRDLRSKVFRKVMGFSSAELDRFSTASLITRSTNDVQQIQMVTVMLLRMILYSPILAIGGIINIQRYRSGMTWIIVLAVALVISLIFILMMVAMPKFQIMQTKVDQVNLVSREILTGLPVIRAFSREKKEEERFDEVNTDLTKVMLFTNRAMSFMMPMMNLIMNGISVLIVWVAAKKIDAGVLEVGSMTALITYAMLIIMSFLMLSMVSIMLPRAGVAADRINELLISQDQIKNRENAVTDLGEDATVRFEHVSFRYPDGEENAIEDIDFIAKPGQTTAIIGSTGCGKSTLVKLIPRFFDVTEGRICIGDHDIRDVAIESLRKQIGYVPQKGILFSGDIASNIAFGAPDATEEEIKEAAEIAQAREFIEEKPDQYHSAISQGGTNVSGGQKQRLSIARAIARNPKVYIFDDSFSALDFKTDMTLRKALAARTKKATVIIVAQRVSTILNADQIIVLEEGKMLGKGTHRELVETCEIYRQIAQSQLSEEEFEASIRKEEA